MNNNKMTRVANNLDILVNVGGKITAAAGILCTLISILALIFGEKMFLEGAVTLDLDFIKFHLNDNAYINAQILKFYVFAATLGGGIVCFLIYHIAKLLRSILSPMKMGRPFEAGAPEYLKRVGWAILIGGFLSELVGILARVLLIRAYSLDDLFSSPAIEKMEFVFTMELNFVLIACAVFLLSYIFTYGQVLQRDSDETL